MPVLRKYLRPQSLGGFASNDMARAKTALNAETVAPFKSYADAIDNPLLSSGVSFALCSPTERMPRSADNGVVDPFVRTREFRRN